METELRDAAAARGAVVNDRGNGHYQIKGYLLVNYYPLSKKRTAYVAATVHGKHNVTPQEAVEMAFRAPPVAPLAKKDTRHGHARTQRKRLIRKNGPFCHWCKCRVTLDTSTVEHIVPLHRGGLDNANNRALACKDCNHKRGHDMPELASVL